MDAVLPLEYQHPGELTRHSFCETIFGTSPSAGAAFTLAMAGEYFTRPLSVCFQIVSDANAANRAVRVTYETAGGNVYARTMASPVQVASKTVLYQFFTDAGTVQGVADTFSQAGLPPIVMAPTDVLAIRVGSIQAGDQISAVALVLERFHRNPLV